MQITVRFFAILRERAGTDRTSVILEEGADVTTACRVVVQLYPAIAVDLQKSAIAINREYADRHALLKEADELALIPPVSGG